MDITTTLDVIDFLFDEDDEKICVFCDEATRLPYCISCQEYKGLMTIAEWENYTGETWDE